MDNVRCDERSRRLEMSESQEDVAGDGVPQAPRSDRGRRHLLGSLAAAGVAVFAGLGWGEPAVAAKQGRAMAERHPSGDGHPHGKRGKRGEAGPGGPAGSPGSPGEKGSQGEKGDKGDAGNQGDKGDQGDQGTQGLQGPGKTMLTGTTTWNPMNSGSFPNGITKTHEVAVSGAAVGDPVVAGFTAIPFDGMPLYGRVSRAGTVTVSFTNFTGAQQTVDSGTLTVVVVKP